MPSDQQRREACEVGGRCQTDDFARRQPKTEPGLTDVDAEPEDFRAQTINSGTHLQSDARRDGEGDITNTLGHAQYLPVLSP